jgi:hypothetical protein
MTGTVNNTMAWTTARNSLLFAFGLLVRRAEREFLSIDDQLLAKADIRGGKLVRIARNGNLITRLDRFLAPTDVHILQH